jgi:hypothetical protein
VIWGFSWWPLKFFAALGLDGHSVSLTAYSVVAIVSLPFIWRERTQCRQEWYYLLMIGIFFGAFLAFIKMPIFHLPMFVILY